jgi:hypothetical protein
MSRLFRSSTVLLATSTLMTVAAPWSPAYAHGVAGDRFFPSTIATDDPFVADELSLPTVAHFRTSDDPSARETDISAEWSKRLTQNLGVSFNGGWTQLDTSGQPRVRGFQNLETTVMYQAVTSARHEAVVSLGVTGEWGGTGSTAVGAERFGVVKPTLSFGKGLGDLPRSVSWLRPAALTGVVGYAIPTQSTQLVQDPDCPDCAPARQGIARNVEWGVALEYSLRYLHGQVKDLGLPNFINQLTPLVEITGSTPVANTYGAATTGTVNPGLLWSGRSLQLGVEAQIPMNRASGRDVGVVFQVHWFLDDLFPHSLGRPLW